MPFSFVCQPVCCLFASLTLQRKKPIFLARAGPRKVPRLECLSECAVEGSELPSRNLHNGPCLLVFEEGTEQPAEKTQRKLCAAATEKAWGVGDKKGDSPAPQLSGKWTARSGSGQCLTDGYNTGEKGWTGRQGYGQ